MGKDFLLVTAFLLLFLCPAQSQSPSLCPSPTPSHPPAASTANVKSPFSTPAPEPESQGYGLGDTKVEPGKSSRGMSAGQKAGVAIGVIFGLAVAGLVFLIYRKRRENVRRAGYGLGVQLV